MQSEQKPNGHPHKSGARYVSLAVVLLLAASFLTIGPRTWATSPQSQLYQTVPTRTPTPTFTIVPTATPTYSPTAAATSTPTPGPTNTPVPTNTPTPTNPPAPTNTPDPTDTATSPPAPTQVRPTATPTRKPTPRPTDTPVPLTPTSSAPQLELSQTSSSENVVPDSEITITLRLTVSGEGELSDVVAHDTVPQHLTLQELVADGTDIETRDGQWFVTFSRLVAGETTEIVLRMLVSAQAQLGQAIVHQPSARVGDVEQLWPPLTLLLPPAGLPETGGQASVAR